MAKGNSSNEIHITRVYDAPIALVWEAWTDPAQAAQWWGPRGFTLTTHSKDLRTGGTWRYTMHGPDGTDHPNVARYLEVQKHTRLVYDHGGTDDSPPLFRVTVLFKEVGGRTQLDLTMRLATAEKAEETRRFIKEAGGNATWDRLAEFLEKKSSGKEVFVINRTFEAPIDTVFEMWTNPAHLVQWSGPTGSTMKFIEVDIRAGGRSHYSMEHGGVSMFGKVSYVKVERPSLLVYAQEFCDEHGNVARHPLAPTWPQTMLTRVSFSAEAPDRTRVTVHWEVAGTWTPEELETFIQGRTGMTQGWTGSFDKLDEYLLRVPSVRA